MKAKDSQIVKGIAILMMLFHHLFALKKLTQFNVTNFIPILNLILFTLGKYSMVMWLVSDFLIKYYFSHFTYSFKNVWLILVITLAAAFLFSFIFENFSRIFKSKFVDSLYSKIVAL